MVCFQHILAINFLAIGTQIASIPYHQTTFVESCDISDLNLEFEITQNGCLFLDSLLLSLTSPSLGYEFYLL